MAIGRSTPLAGLVVTAALVAAGALGWAVLSRPAAPPGEPADAGPTPDPPPPDPRLTFPTPFRNVRPGVEYVGDAACAGCHPRITETYHAHPMGRSAEIVGRAPVVERYDVTAIHPSALRPFGLRVEKTAAGVVQRLVATGARGTPLPEYVVTADIAVGSGTRGRSYLWSDQGAVWQSPVSWMTGEGRWKLFPGFHHDSGGAWPVTPDCLFCHVDRVEPVSRSLNRYREPLFPTQVAIGCERCHGPGGLHVHDRADHPPDGPVDATIVNPKHLPPELRAGVCAQCHLQGEERVVRRGREVFEFRPGLPYEQFVTVCVRRPDLADASHTGGQFEQMEQSRCFVVGAGRLGCTTCHDPHSTPPPATRDGFYREKCLSCHESKGCTAPPPERAGAEDNCVACHMPRAAGSNISHVSVTDHRILRRPGATRPGRPSPGGVPLVAFRTGRLAPPTEERERDLGIALARLTAKISPSARASIDGMSALAADRLAASLGRWPGDQDAWVALAVVRGARGEDEARWAAASNAVRLAPDSEPALTAAAEAALTVGRFDEAADAAARLIGLNPSAPKYRMLRAVALVRKGSWAEAEGELRTVLRANPLHVEGRFFLAVCRHRVGDAAAAQREIIAAAGLLPDPRYCDALFDRFRRETR